MLSWYDAELCYDCFTDTFQARYPSHYSRTPVIEQCVHWDRIRAPPVDIPPHNVHALDCLDKLHPGTMLRFSGEETKNFLMGGGMVLLVTWRLAMRLEVSAVVIRADIFVYGGYLRLCSPFHRHRNGCLDYPSLNMLASGPYGLIFSSFVPFYFDIPVSTRHGFAFLELTSLTSRLYIWQVFSTFSHRGKDLCCQEYVVFLPVFSIVAIFSAYAASSSQSLSVIIFTTVLAHFGRFITFSIKRECYWKCTILYRREMEASTASK
ncbi:hypothetical protein IFM89_024645 [Coptis chinensis]|uniref:Uncharacterized protein n=1 Tax=Coptis chinensis TaxID=261450 RepID=A0A835LIH0_9MAGN|nr:hypothetical protein IFM89_024645 [Coptis chinensis]